MDILAIAEKADTVVTVGQVKADIQDTAAIVELVDLVELADIQVKAEQADLADIVVKVDIQV